MKRALRNALLSLGLLLGVWLAVVGAPAESAAACACVMVHAPGSACCCEGEGDNEGAVCEEAGPVALPALVLAGASAELAPAPATGAALVPARLAAVLPAVRAARPRALDPPSLARPPPKEPVRIRFCSLQV